MKLNEPPHRDTTFDAHADDYEAVVAGAIAVPGVHHAEILDIKARHLLAEAGEPSGSAAGHRVLDVGCGVGSMMSRIAGDGRRVVGIDVSLRSLSHARRRCPEGSFVCFDGQCLPFGDQSFDLVFASCVLHHVPAKERPPLVGEMVRLSSESGVVVILEHNPYNPLTRLIVARCPFDRDAVLLRPGEAATLLEDAGLSTSRRHLLFVPWVGTIWDRLERALRWVPLGAQYLVAARRRRPREERL